MSMSNYLVEIQQSRVSGRQMNFFFNTSGSTKIKTNATLDAYPIPEEA